MNSERDMYHLTSDTSSVIVSNYGLQCGGTGYETRHGFGIFRHKFVSLPTTISAGKYRGRVDLL
jgi:hypothetical protein